MENAVLGPEMETMVRRSKEGIEIHLPNAGTDPQYLSILAHVMNSTPENPTGVWILNLADHKDIPLPLLNALLYLTEQARRFGCEIKLTGIGKSHPIPAMDSSTILPLSANNTTWTSSFGVVISAVGSEYEITLHPF